MCETEGALTVSDFRPNPSADFRILKNYTNTTFTKSSFTRTYLF